MSKILKELKKVAQDMDVDIDFVKEELDSVNDAIEEIEEAGDFISQAGYKMESVARTVKDIEGLEYNMEGNMRGYVINYLHKAHDSLDVKLEKYIEQLGKYQKELKKIIRESR